MTAFTPRPSQSEILAYRRGKMGISAVPGSGKTHTLSALAAEIIARGGLGSDQEVLIVTLVNSAVDNFSSRVSGFIQAHGLLPHIGYRVRTLHGLAHDIVREKPALVGLEERFSIIDEREADFIRKEAAQAWLQAHPCFLDDYLDPAMDDSKREWVRRQQLPELVEGLALSFIRSAKDRRLSPEDLRRQLDRQPAALPLAEMGWEIYANYQRALTYRGAVDFDDLIRLALHLLELDTEYLERLRYRWPYILEDEAQDSSLLQEQILRLLAGGSPERSENLERKPKGRSEVEGGNWVRVGDPNQAIFETFTTANPRYLRDFIAHEAGFRCELPDSGRSQPSIITLANYLIDWVNGEHPDSSVREALTVPYIQPAPAGDPQPNPPDDPTGIRLIGRKLSPDEEIAAVVDSLTRWLPEHRDWTVAVLVPRNQRGVEVIEALKKHKIDYIEFLASTSSTRAAAGALGNVVAYLADPQSSNKLARVYQVWRRGWREGEDDQREMYKHITELLRKCREVESFLAPRPDWDWLAELTTAAPGSPDPDTEPTGGLPQNSERRPMVSASAGTGVPRRARGAGLRAELEEFRKIVHRWQGTTLLPIDQMILTLAQDLFTEAADLALAHKLALVLRRTADDHADWRLPELTGELGVIARNERRFIGFSSDDSGFDPGQHRGKVVVTTMHKAKGLEWDRVYLMSVNNYDFPSLQPYDRYIAEKWFVRGVSTALRQAFGVSAQGDSSTTRLNLEAEALAQLEVSGTSGEYKWYTEGTATEQARLDYVKERLRLLYVGITRARRELVVTWNSGRTGEQTQALPFVALQGWWESGGRGK